MAFDVKYVYQIIDRFSGPAKRINASAKQINRTVARSSNTFNNFRLRAGLAMGIASNRVRAFAKQSIASFRSVGNSMDDMQKQMGKLVVVAVGLFALAMPIKHAMAFEDAMADVAKVVDFKSPDGLKRMGADILNLSKITPVAAKDLAAIAAVGGQMGIAERDIVGFTDTVSKMSVAFGISADGAAVSMAKIANIFKIPASEFETFADTINFISNNTVVSADEMLRALQNKGAAAGKQMGFTADQTAALSAAFVATGVNADRVGSLMQGMGRGLNKVAQGNKKFAEIMEKSPIKAMQILSNSIVNLDDVSKKVQLQEIFGIDFAGRIGELLDSMKGSGGVVKTMFALAASQEKVGSVNKEFQIRINTSASKMKIMQNEVASLAIKIGAQLLPVVNLLFDGIGSLASAIGKVVDKTGPLIPMILGAVTALLAFKAAAILAKIAMIAFNFAAAANPIGLVIAAVAALVTWIAISKEQFGGWTEAIIHVGTTIHKWLLSPLRLIMFALDAITGADALGFFDSMVSDIEAATFRMAGLGKEFDSVMAKRAEIAAASDVSANVAGSTDKAQLAQSADSTTKVDVTLNDPGGAVKAVETKSKGPAKVRVGQNMGLAF